MRNIIELKDNGTVEFNYSIIQDMMTSWNENYTDAQNSNPPDSQSSAYQSSEHPYFPKLPVLLNLSMFSPAIAFKSTGVQGNSTRGPNGDLDNDGLTNYA